MKLGLTLLLPVIQVGYGAFVLPTLSSAMRGPNSHMSGRFPSLDMPGQFSELEAVAATLPRWAPCAHNPSNE